MVHVRLHHAHALGSLEHGRDAIRQQVYPFGARSRLRVREQKPRVLCRRRTEMEHLTTRDRELVALGAALGSNCVPCIEAHVPAARKAGLSDSEIREAVRQADELRHIPAAKVLKTALAMLGEASDTK